VFTGCGEVVVGPPCAQSPAGLQARWRGDGNAADETGVYDGITSGGFTPAGRHGSAFLFDGEHIFTADMNDQLWPAASFSLEAWVKMPPDPASDNSSMVVEKYDCGYVCGGNSEYLFEIYGGGEPVFQYRTADMADPIIDVGSIRVNDDIWHHLVGVRDVGKKEQRFYIDGNLAIWSEISGAALGALINGDAKPDPITIGAGRNSSQPDPTYFFHGAVDEVAVYFSALSNDEVAAIYAARNGICPRM
jgi:hypothetical protein